MTEVTNANARDRRKEFLVGALPHQLQLWLKPQDQLLVALQHHPQPRAQPAKLRPRQPQRKIATSEKASCFVWAIFHYRIPRLPPRTRRPAPRP
ncbi:hypothetical protein PGT21_000839 [Puccinia graminis f. sp. tritici]|uniref:Uncharacterized protein n=1 Tax=Puccinia graminis f. sp. tritici TaxID=56615 RepID=A0A5B0NAH0_PUCGR|nr:hypothetical protein PGT21_000839 [Puccinia graminis f. sp. tritici]